MVNIARPRRMALAILSFIPGLAVAQENADAGPHNHAQELEEVVVTATPFEDQISESLIPVSVLSGEALQREVANSLGETLDGLPGVHSSSFGSGVGLPVIRGQSGKRVQVLQSGVEVNDASNVSPDHAIGVEPLLADRIEVLRGPSTLLYGNGAIGGVVNVVDGRIPEDRITDPVFIAEQSHSTVSGENKTIVRLDASAGNLAFHFDAVTRDAGNVEIPGFAVDVAAIEALEEMHGHSEEHDHEDEHGEEDHDEEHGHDEEEIENTFGFVGNSQTEGESVHGGLSLIGDRGFLGFSVGRITSNYGLPPGVHDHAHDEHEDHGDEEHEGEEAHDEEEDAHGEEDVRIRLDMEQLRYDVKGAWAFESGPIERIRASLGYTDYEHSEIEFEGDEVFIGTTYANRGVSGRIKLDHAPVGELAGVWGLQFSATEFSATGAEAFIPRADIDSAAIFVVERLATGDIDWEFGARYEQRDIDPDGVCESSDGALSLSASMLYDVSPESNVLLAVSRSERNPTVEELYSNITGPGCTRTADDEALVLHAATGLLEVGNPGLDSEVATNLELGFRKFAGRLRTQVSAFYNEVDDYIYLGETGEFEEQTIASYQSRNATFTGVEAEVEYGLLDNGIGTLDLALIGDAVRAEFDDGSNVPRIPAARLGGRLDYARTSWTASLSVTRTFEQDRVSSEELPTDAYTLVSLYADYHWKVGETGEFMVFANASNLLDEEVRNHVSFLKNYAPEPGRNVRVGVRLAF